MSRGYIKYFMGRLNDAVSEYAKKNPARFHMPGHKGRAEYNPGYSLDVTELFFTDNLYSPDSNINFIYGLEKRISECFFNNSNIKSFISCSGATLCIQGALLSLVKAKNKKNNLYMICGRESHISFINAIDLLNITPLWIEPEEYGNLRGKIELYARNENIDNIAGVFLTSPDYYGRMKDIKAAAEICKTLGLKLAVDNSHGSHLAFHGNGELHPINLGADISIDSIHKTLPALTGSALLHLNPDKNEIIYENIRQCINTFATTSPSFLILQSIEKAIDLLEKYGKIEHGRLAGDINLFLGKAVNLGFVFDNGEFYDPYRIVLDCENSGEKLYYFLAENNIFCEFFGKDSVIIIPSISNSPDDFLKLAEKLTEFARHNKIIPVKSKKFGYPPGFNK
ncbi:MAG: hypothetical protein FWH10_07485 [Oscillospiraceae bacterium]|nr:hypothetical protein [Oscillospiraceae bacterium]